MAETIWFPDGTHEVLFHTQNNEEFARELEMILQDKLGPDMAAVFHRYANRLNNDTYVYDPGPTSEDIDELKAQIDELQENYDDMESKAQSLEADYRNLETSSHDLGHRLLNLLNKDGQPGTQALQDIGWNLIHL